MRLRAPFILSLILWFNHSVVAQDSLNKSGGAFSGEWRTFYLNTFNKGELKDYYGLATGGKIKYVYSLGEHFKLGGAAYTSLNLGIQDLSIPDPITGKFSRYESGLFNVQDYNDRFIFILGELFVRYTSPKHELTLGRMKLATPWINPEDGRMIPTLAQGLWYTYQPQRKYKLQLGVLNAIGVRSTNGFFNIGESIGKYPLGRNPDGSPSLYAGNTESDYIAIANLDIQPLDFIKVELWNYYVDHVFNTSYLRPVIDLDDRGTKLSLEWMHQERVGEGGNSVDSLRYFTDERANVLGVQLEFKVSKTNLTFAYDHILDGGRFLFPREWGREPLFSFQKRERSEGTANSHAVVYTFDRTFPLNKDKLQSIISIGHHWKPPVTNAADNKYAMPDYTHLNLDFFYHNDKVKRLKPELLLTYKMGSGNYPEHPNFIINKVDMFQINFIVNYNF
ncbi:OprD family outer membrane porin [Catalinimonas sp. 4WD22]|uniref:OprD family outer membrane porin n=1 Tax=Catalinimonas locisalis TaxID=3133978 RepID=UPI00310151A9